jgi:hypothetical protein
MLLVFSTAFGQEEEPKQASMLIGPNFWGPFIGLYNISFELPIGNSFSLELNPLYLNLDMSLFKDMFYNTNVWCLGLQAGPNLYLGKRKMEGLFIGPFVNLGYASVENSGKNSQGFLVGGNIKIGYRWIWGWFSLAPQIGVGYNKFMSNTEGFDSEDSISQSFDGPMGHAAIGATIALY